ncbi:MAG TPA: hypothetical protein VF845_04035 [Terriglobales bacterium]
MLDVFLLKEGLQIEQRSTILVELLGIGPRFPNSDNERSVSLAIASLLRLVPPLVIIAFVPTLVRGTWWFFRGPQPLDIKKLGWSEMTQGVVFGILLAIAFLLP